MQCVQPLKSLYLFFLLLFIHKNVNNCNILDWNKRLSSFKGFVSTYKVVLHPVFITTKYTSSFHMVDHISPYSYETSFVWTSFKLLWRYQHLRVLWNKKNLTSEYVLHHVFNKRYISIAVTNDYGFNYECPYPTWISA